LRDGDRIEALRKVPLFAHCSGRELRELVSIASETDYPSGTELTREGGPGRDFLVLLEGRADVIRGGQKIAERGPGDFFGEVALISHGPRNATIVTTTLARVLTINDRAFRALLGRMPEVQASVFRALAERVPPAKD
jgi:CRP/FNR family transcriptional regulator, cyclic AMP receptor protein